MLCRRHAMGLAGAMRVAALGLCAGLIEGCSGDDTPDAGDGGAVCARDADCPQSRCGSDPQTWTAADLEPLELWCNAWDDGLDDGAVCDGSAACGRGLCVLAGTCVAPCVTDDDCAPTHRCQDVFVRGEEEALHPVTACVERVSLPTGAAVDREVLLETLTGAPDDLQPGALDTLTLAAATGPTLYALQHLGEDAWPGTFCRAPICVEALRSIEDGTTLFSLDTLDDAVPINPVSDTHTADPTVVYVGNGPASPYSAGGYEVDVRSETAGDLRITTLSRTPDGGRLDLNLYYVGAADWEPEGARGNAVVEAALERVDAIFEQAGLFIGEVRQRKVGGALPERGIHWESPENPAGGLAALSMFGGTWLELPHLQRLSAGAGNVAANVFLVGDIEGAQGLSGCVPGAMGMHGTGASGIVINASSMGGADQLGRRIAHELGHYLGLFHPIETNGEIWSPITDVTDEADNLMSATGTGETLTAQQHAILQQAMILQ